MNDPTAKAVLYLAILSAIAYKLDFVFEYVKEILLKRFTHSLYITGASRSWHRPKVDIDYFISSTRGLFKTTNYSTEPSLDVVYNLDSLRVKNTFNYYRILNTWVSISKTTDDEIKNIAGIEHITTTFNLRVYSKDKEKLFSVLKHITDHYESYSNSLVKCFEIIEVSDAVDICYDITPDHEYIEKQYASKMYYEVLKDLEDFYSSKLLYKENGWRWRRMLILDGVPGTGKTSMIIKMAKHLNKKVYVYPASLLKNLNKFIRNNSGDDRIILIDDIDRSYLAKGLEKSSTHTGSGSGMEFSDLLNLLDGAVGLPAGTFIIGTTNNVNLIDEALFRKGRVDKVYTIAPLDREDAEGLVKNYIPSYTEEDVNECAGKPIAYATNYCIEKAKKEVKLI